MVQKWVLPIKNGVKGNKFFQRMTRLSVYKKNTVSDKRRSSIEIKKRNITPQQRRLSQQEFKNYSTKIEIS